MSSAQLLAVPGESLAPERTETPAAQWEDLRIKVVDNATDFAALRGEWSELLSSSRSDCLFLTWEWLHTWWTHLGQGKRLFIITVRSGSRLIAIAPLTVSRAWAGPLAVPVLEFAGAGSVGSDYLDFIVRSGWEAAAFTKLTSFLDDQGFSLRLIRARADSAVATALSRVLADRGWECLEIPAEVCPFIALSNDWDSYLSSLRRKHRSNFNRSLRNLEREHEFRIEYADSEPGRRNGLRRLVDLHLLRWKGRGGSDAFNTTSLLAFHEEMSRLSLQRGWLRLMVITLDEKAAAAFYGFRYGRTFHFYQSGFDPAYQRYSVGLVAVGLSIRDAIEEGAGEYDLLHGNEAYKSLWATQTRRLVRLELYPPGLRGRIHRNTARLAGATKNFVKRVLRPPDASNRSCSDPS